MQPETKINADMFHAAICGIFRDPVDLALLAGYESIQLDGETDLVVQLIDLYFDEVPRQVQAMRDAAALRSWAALASAAHSLRGSSANLGAQQVAQICAEIEGMKPIGTWSNIPSLLSRLELECDRALHIFKEERRARLQ